MITVTTVAVGRFSPVWGEVLVIPPSVKYPGRREIWFTHRSITGAGISTQQVAEGIELAGRRYGNYLAPQLFRVALSVTRDELTSHLFQVFGDQELAEAVMAACLGEHPQLIGYGGRRHWSEGGVADVMAGYMSRTLRIEYDMTSVGAGSFMREFTALEKLILGELSDDTQLLIARLDALGDSQLAFLDRYRHMLP
jgi:hypothetical protein